MNIREGKRIEIKILIKIGTAEKSFSCQEWKILRTNLKWWEKVYLLLCGTLNKESCKPQEHLKSKEILSDFMISRE